MKVLRAGGALQNASRSSTISHYGFTFARRAHGVRESIGQRLSWRCVLRIHEYVSYGTVPCHDYGHGVAGVRRRPGEARRSAARSPQTRRKKARLLPPLFSASFVRRPARRAVCRVAVSRRSVQRGVRVRALVSSVQRTPRSRRAARGLLSWVQSVTYYVAIFLKLYSSRTKKRAFNDPHQTTVAAASAHVSSDARHATAAVETTSSVRKCNRRTCSIYGAAFFSPQCCSTSRCSSLPLAPLAIRATSRPILKKTKSGFDLPHWSSNLGTASAFTSHHLMS